MALNKLPVQAQSDVMGIASAEVIEALLESALNVMAGNVPLTNTQYNRLKRHKTELWEFT